jgi:hypothetical protein
MTRRIAVEIGNATAKHCKDCPKFSTIWTGVAKPYCLQFNIKKPLTETMGGDVNRCTAYRKAEIREEVKP